MDMQRTAKFVLIDDVTILGHRKNAVHLAKFAFRTRTIARREIRSF